MNWSCMIRTGCNLNKKEKRSTKYPSFVELRWKSSVLIRVVSYIWWTLLFAESHVLPEMPNRVLQC